MTQFGECNMQTHHIRTCKLFMFQSFMEVQICVEWCCAWKYLYSWHLKSKMTGHAHVGTIATVQSTAVLAVLEYLTAGVLKLAGNVSKDLKIKGVIPSQLQSAICANEELDSLLKAAIAIIPRTHRSLIGRSRQQKTV